MASLTPRASGFWADDDSDEELQDQGNTNMGVSRSKHWRTGLEDEEERGDYFGAGDGDLEQQERLLDEESAYDGRTPVSMTRHVSYEHWKGGNSLILN